MYTCNIVGESYRSATRLPSFVDIFAEPTTLSSAATSAVVIVVFTLRVLWRALRWVALTSVVIHILLAARLVVAAFVELVDYLVKAGDAEFLVK